MNILENTPVELFWFTWVMIGVMMSMTAITKDNSGENGILIQIFSVIIMILIWPIIPLLVRNR